jgi:hypothetical protein
MFRFLITLLLAGLCCSSAQATGSLHPTLELEGGQSGEVVGARESLYSYPSSVLLRALRSEHALRCSAGGSPTPRYRLRGPWLELVGFSGCGNLKLSLAQAYGPDSPPARQAIWVTGKLRVPLGKALCGREYDYSLLEHGIWEREIELHFERGYLRHRVHKDQSRHPRLPTLIGQSQLPECLPEPPIPTLPPMPIAVVTAR